MSTLREIQLCGLDILKELDRVCKKNDLHYFLTWGSLLGAVRHKGFIPWDNDIDVTMPIEDYRKLLKIAKTEFSEKYFLQTYKTDRGYNEMWAKIRANGTTSMPLIWKKYSIHLGISIDIFPLVGWAGTPRKRRTQEKAFAMCRTLLAKEQLQAINSPELSSQNIKLRLLFGLPWSVRIFLCGILEKIAFRKIKSDGHVAVAGTGLRRFVPASAYGTGILLPFEDGMFPAPVDWDLVLKEFYGDYMTPPPPEERVNLHEYKFGEIIYDCEKDYREYR